MRFASCSAIGNIVGRYQEKLVPWLIEASKAEKDIYIYIYIFKEMLGFNTKSLTHLHLLI